MSENNNLPTVKVVVNGKYALKQGDLFESYDELRQRMDDHSKESFVYYWLRDSRTVEGAFKKASRPIQKRLKYYSVKYACIFGGQRFCPRGNGRRNLQTIRNNCPAYVLVRASKCGYYLEVISVCHEHNHEVSEDVSKSLSQNRKPSPEIRDEIQQMLLLKIDRNTIIEYVRLKYEKTLTKKDLFNLGARTKRLYANYLVDEKLAKAMKQHMDDYIRDHKSESSEDQDEVVVSSEVVKPDDGEHADGGVDCEMDYEDPLSNKEIINDDLIEYVSDDGNNHEENCAPSSIDDYCDTSYVLETSEQKSGSGSPINDNTIVYEVYSNELASNDFTSSDLADTQALLAVLNDNDNEIENNVDENQTMSSEEFIFEEVEILSDIQQPEEIIGSVNHVECDKCGQNLIEMQKQIQTMERYYQKLEEETRVLELKRNQLKGEIAQKMQKLFNF